MLKKHFSAAGAVFCACVAAFWLGSCSQPQRLPSSEPPSAVDSSAGSLPFNTITASVYGEGDGFHGRKTASGEIFDAHALTCAHRTFPFGTMLEVRNPENGEVVRCRVNDRGPFVKGRSLDMSAATAKTIGVDSQKGVQRVEIRKLGSSPGDIRQEKGNDGRTAKN